MTCGGISGSSGTDAVSLTSDDNIRKTGPSLCDHSTVEGRLGIETLTLKCCALNLYGQSTY